ncbi:MAG: dipeptide ABC transporter ATP-binding protein [Alphaproteobacteria bacterium]|nr:dipeptide ABC transporter ATP-binding protein [Alphaproteobacteria bacterium]MCY4230710.1 dipeptide ABC transporter ATP-binding protein [Alphaproteobacteria bacterium]MCY4319017.1 dipeptide ABC transporter ATP-binding protein [Alphaproteobacteria bacterium]
MSEKAEIVLEVRDLKTHFPVHAGLLRRRVGSVLAVDGVSFDIRRGETLGLVGESGSGKSTVGKTVLRLIDPTSGEILVRGEDVTHAPAARMRALRRQMQMVFQDPYASLNPRLSAQRIVAEPLENYSEIPRAEIEERVQALFARVGLRPDQMAKYPHEFSGGQRQRLGVARALALEPGLIVADEPVSALDVSVQAQVLNLLMDLQDEFDLAYLFISHDLAVVEHISHRVAVMYLGKIVELTDRATLFSDPRHPYTRALLSAAPAPEPGAKRERIILKGDIPSPINPPAGCRFHTRCPLAEARCRTEEPAIRFVASGHRVACHLVPGAEPA